MSRCDFSERSLCDLQQIPDYIAYDSVANADRLIDRLEDLCFRLADQPLMGVLRPESGPGVRIFAVPSTPYMIFYRPIDDGVAILHIRHGSRRLPESIGD